MRTKIVLFITILICFLLQSTVIPEIAIGSIAPNLPVVLCISMGLMRGRKSGLWTGFFCGILIDLFYGSLFGFYALIYMYIGYFSGYAHRICYDDDIKVPLLLVTAGDFLYGIAVYALQFLLRGRLGFRTYLFRIILPEVFYTAFLAMFIYRIFYLINYRLMKTTRKESESIWVIKSGEF